MNLEPRVELVDRYDVGESVTPTDGVFVGRRFVVMETRLEDNHVGPELRIRLFPARMGGPHPMWVPATAITHFFAAGACVVCGASNHQVCDPPLEVPEVGWPIAALKTIVRQPHGRDILVGERGVVTQVEHMHLFIAVEFDAGERVIWVAPAIGDFFIDVEVL